MAISKICKSFQLFTKYPNTQFQNLCGHLKNQTQLLYINSAYFGVSLSQNLSSPVQRFVGALRSHNPRSNKFYIHPCIFRIHVVDNKRSCKLYVSSGTSLRNIHRCCWGRRQRGGVVVYTAVKIYIYYTGGVKLVTLPPTGLHVPGRGTVTACYDYIGTYPKSKEKVEDILEQTEQ